MGDTEQKILPITIRMDTVIFLFYFIYFISFALRNTKKNTEDMQTLVIRM